MEISPDKDALNLRIDNLRAQYRHHAEAEHGTIINPITGEEVDIMQQCVNLQLDADPHTLERRHRHHRHHEVGDTDAYREVIRDFAQELWQDMPVWMLLESGEYEMGRIHRVNKEDEHHVTYDFQYSKVVKEGGKSVDKVFILKDKPREVIKTRQLLVKGDPAGGKTTFAKQLLTWIMREPDSRWLVPVLVRTIDLVRSHDSFCDDGRDMVQQYLALTYKETPSLELFELARRQGRLLVILDGFDEAGQLESELAKQISAKLNNEVFLIVTSREMSGVFTGADFGRFRDVRVKELNESQRRCVIERRLTSAQAVEDFCTQLTLNPALCLMTRNPLLLNVTLSVFESSGQLAGASLNRGRVYGLALDGMLNNVEKMKSLRGSSASEGLRAGCLRTVLKSLAFEAHSTSNGRGIRDFRRSVVEKAIRACHLGSEFGMAEWGAVEDIIKKGRLPVLTWFCEDGEDTFRFAHLTFQEFLCAEHCLDKCQQNEDFIFELRELICRDGPHDVLKRGWWQQTIQMFCDLSIATNALHSSKRCWGSVLGECLLRLGEFAADQPPLVTSRPASPLPSDSELEDVEDRSCSSDEEPGFLVFNHTPPSSTSRSRASAGAGEEPHSTVDFHRGVNDTNILTVLSMLRGSRAVKHLKLGGGLSSSGLATIRTLQVSSLRRLHLNQNFIGPDGCRALADFLRKTGSPLEELLLVHNILCQGAPKEQMPPPSRRNPPTGYYDAHQKDVQGLTAVLETIRQHPTMRVLDVRGNFLPLEAGSLLLEAARANPNLQEVCGVKLLHLRSGDQTELVMKNDSIFFNPEHSSSSSQPYLSTGGAYFLVQLLLQYPQPELKKLDLSNQALASDAAGAVELYDKLGLVVSRCPKLEELNISGYWDSGTAPGQALGRHLASHPSLATLAVGTGSVNWKELREQGRSGTQVTLQLGSSRMRDCGAGILSQCLPPNVTKLNLKDSGNRGAGLGASGYKVLSQCPDLCEIDGVDVGAFQESCVELDFSTHPPQSSGAVAAIIARTALTPNLQRLNLSGSNLTSKSHVHPLTPVVGGYRGIGCNGGCDCRSFEGTNAYTHCAECDLDFCSTCCMSECPMISLAESLDRLPHLVSLGLADCCFQGGRQGPVRSHLDVEGYDVLGKALSRHPCITELDLSKNFFQGQGFPYLLKGVAQMEALVSVKMSTEPMQFQELLRQEEVEAMSSSHAMEVLLLCLAIRRNPGLRCLDFSKVSAKSLPVSTTRSLVTSLQQLRAQGGAALERVSLPGGVELRPRQLEEGGLSSLDLSSKSRIDRLALAPLLAFALERSRLVNDVDFTNNEFGLETDHIVDAVLGLATKGRLANYNGLPLRDTGSQMFSMEQKPVMPHGICVFAAAYLARCSCLRVLDLRSCGLDGRSLGAVFSSLLQLKSVISLDISCQPLKKTGVEQLSSFLRADKTLQTLRACDIATPAYYSAEMMELTKAMETNCTLATLDLRQNQLHAGVAERLRRTMEEKRSTVPMPFDVKICFLLCNRHLPGHLQLPEVSQVLEASRLFTGGAHSPLFMIFQFCGQPRQLFLDESQGRSGPRHIDRVFFEDLGEDDPVEVNRGLFLAHRLMRMRQGEEMADEDLNWGPRTPGDGSWGSGSSLSDFAMD